MSYIYIKKEKKPGLKNKKYLPLFFLISGLLLLSFAVIPIIRFQFKYSTNLKQILNPLSVKSYNQSLNILGDVTADYTQLSNWFINDSSGQSNNLFTNDDGNKYYLSIPKLNIKDATVIIGSSDLKKSLIQYPQTALPGQLGNTVIFGHSVLPQFFNPRSYLTIFSTLHTLKIGDEIDINYDGSQYRYLVSEMYEVKATDFSVLEQRFDDKVITLITCSPPGTYLRRLVVKAEIAL
ncbi:MAG: sortase [Candidatus Shapirobacteria bacterium]|nr:sortase [Candidatus Shapirobacteria bacterium]